MHRFFIDPDDICKSRAVIRGSEAHHLYKVLRLAVGDRIYLFDGSGSIYTAKIESASKNQVTAAILHEEKAAQHGPFFCLGMGMIKGAKSDLVVQKATELGIHKIMPFLSQHCAVQDNSVKRLERWRKIAFEACKQCGRPVLPVIEPVADLKFLLKKPVDYDLKILFWEKEQTNRLADSFSSNHNIRSIMALIGPEGGFNDDEVHRATAAGFLPVTLGSRTLRAETAALAAMAIVQYLLGNLNREY